MKPVSWVDYSTALPQLKHYPEYWVSYTKSQAMWRFDLEKWGIQPHETKGRKAHHCIFIFYFSKCIKPVLPLDTNNEVILTRFAVVTDSGHWSPQGNHVLGKSARPSGLHGDRKQKWTLKSHHSFSGARGAAATLLTFDSNIEEWL